MTLAVSEGFDADELYQEIKRTFSFESLERIEWLQLIQFLVHGGSTLQAYDEYQKIEKTKK